MIERRTTFAEIIPKCELILAVVGCSSMSRGQAAARRAADARGGHGAPLAGGPGADHSIFKPAYSRLADIAQVVYFDHRGDGRCDGRNDPARWRLTQWGDDVKPLCDALEIEHPIVMCVSFGGYVAMSYALRHTDHPAKLILAARRHHPARLKYRSKYSRG
jgi:pimeloyl-ACP methyl ester carboxylesterase